MLNYQLFFLEDLIKQHIRPQIQSKTSPDKSFFSSTVSELEIGKKRILNSLIDSLFNLKNEETIELYIQLHQHNLVALLNLISEDLKDGDIENISQTATWINLYKHIHHTLREILTFIEEKFVKYLDINCKVPAYYLNTAQDTFQKDLQIIEEKGKQAGCDEKLLDVILGFGKNYVVKGRHNRTTYHNLHYLKEVLKRVSELFLSHFAEDSINEKLQDLLFYLNFNTLDYFDYCTETIKNTVNDLPTFREKLDHLYLIKKRANQTPAKPGFIHSKLHPNLQNMLKTWLDEEIKYFKEKELLAAGKILISEELNRWKGFKIITSFSVPQLGNFLRLLVESEVFLNVNKSEILDFFSYFFTSVKQENISAGSLRANFYKDDASVSKAVRDILLTLVNNSRKG